METNSISMEVSFSSMGVVCFRGNFHGSKLENKLMWERVHHNISLFYILLWT